MKKIVLAMVALFMGATMVMAGGDIAQIEETPASDNSGFYVGGGYSYLNTDVTGYIDERFDGDNHGILLVAGYDFNEYIAVEGRYNYGFESGYTYNGFEGLGNIDTDISIWSAFVKPQYPVTNDFSVYALIGISNSTVSIDAIDVIDAETSFAWGVGAAYDFTKNLSVFVDYTNLYNDTFTEDLDLFDPTFDGDIYSVNVGVTYKF